MFPLSNWTELDIWQCIYLEQIPIVPLYFAKERPVLPAYRRAIDSDADDLPAIISEMLVSRTSERQGRLIDSDSAGSMEKKKQEGYF